MTRFVSTLLISAALPCFAVEWTQPVRFEPAASDQSRYIARGLKYGFEVSPAGAKVTAGSKTIRLEFEGAAPSKLEGVGRLESTTNILRGSDPAKWRRGIPNFDRVAARGIYPGIDVIYYSTGGELEYDLVLKPGADPRQIRLQVSGVHPELDADGNLVAGLVHKRPVTYQLTAGGTRHEVKSRFRRNADGSFGFELDRYNQARELVIDPQLTLSAYLSGSNQDVAVAVGHDRKGFIYVGGTTFSTDVPVTADTSLQTVNNGSSDVFVAKIDPNGSRVVYLTYVGGTGADILNDMAVNGDGTVYLTGSTTSIDIPLGNAAQSTIGGTLDGFVLWLDPSQVGTSGIYYGSYLGGSGDDIANGIAVDSRGRILVVGQTKSTDFPASTGYLTAAPGSTNGWMVMIDTARSGAATLAYSTYLGGGGWDAARGVAASADGTAWVTGATYSGDFPMVGLSYQPNYQGGGDIFLAQINPDVAGGSSLLYSTYVGGSGTEEGNRVVVDATGRVFVTGFTLSTDLPVTSTAVQKQLGGGVATAGAANVVVVAVKPSNSGDPATQLVYATYLGGTGGDEGYGLTADAAGNIYVTGLTKSTDFPVTAGALGTTLAGGPAGFVTRLNTARPTVDYSSYVASAGNQTTYGVDVDSAGNLYLTGFTSGPLLDSLGGATKTSSQGDSDAFVLGFNLCGSTTPIPAGCTAPAGRTSSTRSGR